MTVTIISGEEVTDCFALFLKSKNIIMRRKKVKNVLIMAAITLLLVPAALFAKGGAEDEGNELIVYTSLETDETEEYIKAAEAATGLKISWTRFSTGVVGAKLLAERKNYRTKSVTFLSIGICL